MRLTLRTLLAYLDGLLDPKDADELSKKIEESEYATTLVHRIRDAMRRLRLGAPSLTDRGPGLDPNTVAEYLDNTLDSERVSDFEKVCLDSDVHLAEIASCHQILTLVLGEPAEVDLASRQRMYQLQEKPAHTPPLPPPVEQGRIPLGADSPPQLDLGDFEPADRKARLKPTVPEYLREPRRKPVWVSIAAAILLLISVTGIVLKSLGQFEPDAPLGKLLVGFGIIAPAPEAENPVVARVDHDEKRPVTQPQTETPAPDNAMPPAVEPVQKPGTQPTEPLSGSSAPAADQPIKQTTEAPKTAATAEPAKTAQPPFPAPTDAAPPAATAKDQTTPPATPAASTKDPAAPPASVIQPPAKTEPPSVTPPAATATVPPTPPAAVATVPPAKSAPAVPVIPGVDGQTEKPRDATPPAAVAPTNPQREALGRLMSTDQILLSRDSAGEWTRVTPNQILFPQQLLVPPTYCARVALTVGTLDILAGTRVDLLGAASGQAPGIRVLGGRVVLMPLAKAGSKVWIAFGDRSGVISFIDDDSVAALDVRRIHQPGANPETEPARITATLYAVSGGVLWEENTNGKQSDPVRLGSLQRLAFDGQSTPIAATGRELPKWITAEPIKELDRRASLAMAQAMLAEKPNKAANVSLLELAASRRQEVRWLALRSLGYLGQFAEMVAALDDPAHKLDWQDNYVEELRTAIRRDPETAAAVRTALERRYPQQGPDLYRMLCGYSDKDLQGGEDAKLVRGLEDDLLAVRRLSYWNLRDITGLGLFYQPEQPPARRQAGVRAWRQRLDAKEIRLKSLDERTTASPRPKGANEKAAPDRSYRPPAAVPPREPDGVLPQ